MSVHPNVQKIVKLITSEIKTLEDKKEKWASFKRKNAEKILFHFFTQNSEFFAFKLSKKIDATFDG